MSPRRSEKIERSATYLNGLAIAVFAVGGLAPLFSTSRPQFGDPGFWFSVALISACWVASPILQVTARGALQKLPDDDPSDL